MQIKMKNIFQRSIFNLAYNEKLREEILKKITRLPIRDNPEVLDIKLLVQAKIHLLRQIKKQIFSVMKSVDQFVDYY